MLLPPLHYFSPCRHDIFRRFAAAFRFSLLPFFFADAIIYADYCLFSLPLFMLLLFHMLLFATPPLHMIYMLIMLMLRFFAGYAAATRYYAIRCCFMLRCQDAAYISLY